MSKPLRLLFTGAAPWCLAGYGKPLRLLFPALAKLGHEIGLAAFYGYQGPIMEYSIGDAMVRMYGITQQPYFNDMIELHAAEFKADAVISFQDVWILEGWGQRDFDWYPWLPIDHEPVGHTIIKALEGCTLPIAMSRFGQGQLQEHGWPFALYVPIGIDTNQFKPGNQSSAREMISIPSEGFVAGMVAANASSPSRKSFGEVLQAWRLWKDQGGKGQLYLHTTLSPKRRMEGKRGGEDLDKMMGSLGLEWATVDDPEQERVPNVDVLFPSQYRLWMYGYNDEALSHVYNSLDVLLSPSMGEGFGIPIVEAQACGVPVITLNVTSMPELTFSGQCLEPMQMFWEGQGGWRGVAGVQSILGAIQWAFEMSQGPNARQYLKERAVVGAQQYGIERVVTDYWAPFLEMIAT